METAGLINYFRLSDWWRSQFSEDERAAIKSDYGTGAIGISPNSIDEGPMLWTSQSPLSFIRSLQVRPTNPLAVSIADKIARKASELIQSSKIVDVHFYFTGAVRFWQRCKDNVARERMLEAARSLVAIEKEACRAVHADLPDNIRASNIGFDVLYSNAIRRKDFDGADRLVASMGGDPWCYRWDCVKADIAARRAAHERGERFLRKKHLPPECQ